MRRKKWNGALTDRNGQKSRCTRKKNRKQACPLKEARATASRNGLSESQACQDLEKGKWSEAVAVGSESPFLEWRERSCHLKNGANESERKEWAKRGK
ncbi:hypothetical protein DDT91_12230 [Algoriphagus sp. AK58]|nr:hypothetical protein [Algoriphagus sp. AK58]